MKRRSFIALLGGATAWPLAARTQKAAMPMIAHVSTASPRPNDPRVIAFRQGLSETGYVEGRNVAIEYHLIEDQTDKLRMLVADLVRRQVTVIYTSSTAAALVAKSATPTIPIVFSGAADPVHVGLVSSLNKPGGNVTGVTLFSHMLGTKRLELLRQLVANAAVIAMLVNPQNPSSEIEIENAKTAAQAFGMRIVVVNASSGSDFDSTFAAILQQDAHALVVVGDPVISSQRDRVIAFAAQNAIPAIYPFREHVADGGLMGYGPSFTEVSRHAGVYVGRILKGTKPADLPVMLPTKFELAINLKTANALGLKIPEAFLLRADEVIE